MGLFTGYLIYKIGKRRGRKSVSRGGWSPGVDFPRGLTLNEDGTVDECVNYELFCKNFGSCDGQRCQYDS